MLRFCASIFNALLLASLLAIFKSQAKMLVQAAQQKPRLTQQHGNNPNVAPQPASEPAPAEATTSAPLPGTDAEYAALPPLTGALQAGDVVAYKLLEIGYDWAPQVGLSTFVTRQVN